MEHLLSTLLTANQLKFTPRSGWVQRGIPAAENVAAHSYGVALIALTLLDQLTPPPALDTAKVLSMALVHDLAECLIGDLPVPAQRFFPEGAKHAAEHAAFAELSADLPAHSAWRAARDEYETRVSPEAQLVHDADRLDTLLQAYVYLRQTGNRMLHEFWQGALVTAPYHYEVSRQLCSALVARYTALGAYSQGE